MKVRILFSKQSNIDHFNSDDVELDMEEYLVGVVAAEIGNAPLEACKAQAVASRTFALNAIKSKGYITDKSSSDQAFRSERLTGYPNVIQAVKDTKGEVLYYKDKLAKAYYSASNGGYMISAKTRWGGDLPYSVSGVDKYDDGKGNGHGVQLSQVGAKNRAKAGHTYKQILDFYYPGTNIQKIENDTIEVKFPLNKNFLLNDIVQNIEVVKNG